MVISVSFRFQCKGLWWTPGMVDPENGGPREWRTWTEWRCGGSEFQTTRAATEKLRRSNNCNQIGSNFYAFCPAK